MAEHKYSFQNYNTEVMARVVGRSLGISTKKSIEICNHLRGKSIEKAKAILDDAINLKAAIPMKRFNADTGHKKGDKMAAGRYAVKACQEILNLVKACEANAQFKGLNTEGLILIHINAHRGGQQWHYGRLKRRKMKRTHVELVLEEASKKTKIKSDAKEVKTEKPVSKKPVTSEEPKKAEVKTEAKAEVKAEEKKETPKSDSKPVKKPDHKETAEKQDTENKKKN